jgi:hypothetical protein
MITVKNELHSRRLALNRGKSNNPKRELQINAALFFLSDWNKSHS